MNTGKTLFTQISQALNFGLTSRTCNDRPRRYFRGWSECVYLNKIICNADFSVF